MKVTVTRTALILLLSALTSGCGSIINMVEEQHIYGGVSFDADLIGLGNKSSEHGGTGFAILGIIDLPLSFVVDTVFLPVTIPITLLRADPQEAGEDASTPPDPAQ